MHISKSKKKEGNAQSAQGLECDGDEEAKRETHQSPVSNVALQAPGAIAQAVGKMPPRPTVVIEPRNTSHQR